MKTRSLVVILTLVMSLFVSVVPIHAEIVLSTYDETLPETDARVIESAYRAANFITSTNAGGWNLTNATINIGSVTDSSGNFFLSVYDDNAGAPGVSLFTFSGPSNPTAGINTFTHTGFTLASETTYWLVAGVSSGAGEYNWSYWDSPEVSGYSGIWSISPVTTSAGTGGGSEEWLVDTGYPYIFSLQAEAVPEPSTYALLALSVAGLGSYVLRRRRR